jgi:hypothetical protein
VPATAVTTAPAASTEHGKTEGTLRSHQATFQELDFTQSSLKLAKTPRAKSVLDSGWGLLKMQLQYKGQQARRSRHREKHHASVFQLRLPHGAQGSETACCKDVGLRAIGMTTG